MRKQFFITCSSFLLCMQLYSQEFSINGSPCVNSELTFIDETTIAVDSWFWDFGNGETFTDPDSVKYTYDLPGIYSVTLTITNMNGTVSSTQEFEIYENPICDFSVDTVGFSSFTRVFNDLSISNNDLDKFIWNFGDNDVANLDTSIAEYKYSAKGTYQVWHTIVDVYGCMDSVMKTVDIEDIYIVPNVFTPNGDGINDAFIPTVNGVDEFGIEIFSRWGNLVFKREGSKQIIWDGTLPDGSKVTPGTYFYIITAKDAQKVYAPETGFISVFYDKGQ